MKIALVGNQNSGKSTLFNTLTGDNQKIGNWPGVTIDKKSGIIKNTNFEIIDLPGIYSLYSYTKEEMVTRDFLLKEDYDVIINIVDANSIGRGLYLTLQLLELNKNVIIVLNMCDIAKKKGILIDENKLSNLLNNTKVIKISAISGSGTEELISYLKVINKSIYKKSNCKDFLKVEKRNNKNNFEINRKNYGLINTNNFEISRKNYDSSNTNNFKMNRENYGSINTNNFKINRKNYDSINTNNFEMNRKNYDSINANNKELLNDFNYDENKITEKYKQIDDILKSSTTYIKPKRPNITDILDKIFLNKFLAIPIFVFIMFIVYHFSIEFVSNNTTNLVNLCIENISQKIGAFFELNNVSEALSSLVINGIFSGVSTVLSFLPQLICLFIFISILEKVGYMSRIGLIFDKIFRKIGLSGNSIISFILGTGCSVPGIMATKTIKDEQEKRTTAMITSFIPCSAKLPIISLFSSYFFKGNNGLVAVSFYVLGIIIIIFSALILNKHYKESGYISELPEYRLPKLKHVLKDSFEKTFDFFKRAGSVILISSIVVWILSSYSLRLEYGVNIEDSILASIGKTFSWIFVPIVGQNSWEVAVSSIQGLIAKEQVVSSMAIIANLESKNVYSSIFSNGSPFNFFTPASAYAFVCFNLFNVPCFSAVSAIGRTLKNKKDLLKAIAFQTGVAYIVSSVVFFIGNNF